jgi:ABC-type glycerol-3-phosphate transport system substrate-binding protein
LFYGSTIERETTMMKRVFIFVLALALFIAITGGYGQIINSKWVARSFISADQTADEYPLLKTDVAYEFHMNNGKEYRHNSDTFNRDQVGFVIEQQGKWVTLQGNVSGGRQYRQRINLDNVCAIFYSEKLDDQE